MPIDYLTQFPVPTASLPVRLRALLEPVGTSPRQMVEVTTRYDVNLSGPDREYVHMVTAVVPEGNPDVTPLLRESQDGLVSYSVPDIENKGGLANYSPSISDYEYIIASRGDGSFYTYNLAEKVWMSLGLSVRCVGNDYQRLVYDDLSRPQLGVAEGEASNEYFWKPNRNIRWTMSNEYLRKYLWMRGAFGVRVFFYEAQQPDSPELRALMNGTNHLALNPKGSWYEIQIREHNGGLLLQVWGTVTAITPELCQEQTAEDLVWPDTWLHRPAQQTTRKPLPNRSRPYMADSVAKLPLRLRANRDSVALRRTATEICNDGAAGARTSAVFLRVQSG